MTKINEILNKLNEGSEIYTRDLEKIPKDVQGAIQNYLDYLVRYKDFANIRKTDYEYSVDSDYDGTLFFGYSKNKVVIFTKPVRNFTSAIEWVAKYKTPIKDEPDYKSRLK